MAQRAEGRDDLPKEHVMSPQVQSPVESELPSTNLPTGPEELDDQQLELVVGGCWGPVGGWRNE